MAHITHIYTLKSYQAHVLTSPFQFWNKGYYKNMKGTRIDKKYYHILHWTVK